MLGRPLGRLLGMLLRVVVGGGGGASQEFCASLGIPVNVEEEEQLDTPNIGFDDGLLPGVQEPAYAQAIGLQLASQARGELSEAESRLASESLLFYKRFCTSRVCIPCCSHGFLCVARLAPYYLHKGFCTRHARCPIVSLAFRASLRWSSPASAEWHRGCAERP